ncbi:MAG TPA: S1 RNA-binding domain-containing protein, partial [Gaiellaceae bacterium]|nr:S1 RNA-binding domain-containing protein [Gaiellaceae bacterium]
SELLEIGQEVRVKVLDIDRDRQRISLGLKQTQSDPWQQVIDAYEQGDVVEGRVTKVVTFGAFVEVVPGVEGLVHISELATHHVENPREIVQQGETVRAKIIEMDAERRRLSLSLKRVEEGESARPGIGDETAPDLGLSEEVFTEQPAAEAEAAAEPVTEAEAVGVPEDEVVEEAAPAPADEPVSEVADEPVAEVAEEPVAEGADEPVAEVADEAPATEGEKQEALGDQPEAEHGPTVTDDEPVAEGDAAPTDDDEQQ